MREVSCKIPSIFFKPFAVRKIPLTELVAGTNVSLEVLRNKDERLDWTDLCVIVANVRRFFPGEREFLDIGRLYFRAPALRLLFVVARVLFTPLEFYRWTSNARSGANAQNFTCVTATHRELSENELEIDLEIADGLEICWDFFVLTSANYEEMPRLLGYPAARVELTRISRGGRFHITIPKRTRFLTRLRRALSWPFTVRAAARELKEAHETLRLRYDELESSRAAADRQRAMLDTAYRFGQSIWHEREPGGIATVVTRTLVELDTVDGARLVLSDFEDSKSVSVDNGAIGRNEEAIAIELPGNPSHGQMMAWVTGDALDTHRLLELLAPTVSLAVTNARAYRELAEYQRGLEKLVAERTTELTQARDSLAVTVDQLRQAQNARERFFANISHEIRTPLSLIVLAVNDVATRAGALLDERARQSLGSVTEAARKLLRLVDELLMLAAGQENKLVLRPEPTDLRELLTQTMAAWRPAAEQTGIGIDLRLPDRAIAMVDPIAFERVISNLVSNAVKYTPRGGRVEIELVDEARGVRISVADTGPGIDSDLAGRLFGRFERATKSDSQPTGTGIGLALAKQLVEGHGGTISAYSRVDGGTELRVMLPRTILLAEGDAPARPHLVRPASQPTRIVSGQVFAATELSEGTIVLAEDDPNLAELTAKLLCERYTVVVGTDGEAALALVKQYQPQLLITDVDMPGMTGIQLAREFRNATGDQLAPVIIVSAAIDLTTRVAGFEAGAVDYVGKPFEGRELIARVRAHFRMRELAIRLHRAEQLSMLSILTSGLAHELRNPANGIVNAIEPLTALLPPNLPSGAADLLDVVRECSQQIGFLAQQLLGFRSNAALQMQRVEIADLVRRAVVLAQRGLAGVDLRTQLTLDHKITCAPPLIVQVLTNLLENAGHAAGQGGWIELRADCERGKIVVEMTDSGPGVPGPLRDRIFEPFFTTKEPGRGTGLGLSLSRAICQRHGGTLEVRERGQRCVFVLELPDLVAPSESIAL